ncbi:MAG: Glu/Leu/Phe/Val dehydrogenase dimerization domain-containing protein [Pseudomonadota bacterium]
MFDHASFDDHESVHQFHDADTGLKAIIAIHSTTLGPAAGGCRMWNYETGTAMFADVLRLSQGMSYKNAMAGLPLGGGKAVIWGDPHKDKSPDLFRAFGRAIESLNGQYWTAEDVGLSPGDLEAAAEETKYVAGLEDGEAASGDPSPVTALGVFRGILECSKRAFDTDDLNGKRIAVQGVGHVGGGVCLHLAKAGADLVITDVHKDTLSEIASLTGATIVSPDEIYDQEADIFSPNALGAIVNEKTLRRLKAKVIAGGANNQLATEAMGIAAKEAGVLYAPDYVINGGGIINVAAEISGNYSRDWVDEKLDTLMDTLGGILDQSLSEARPTNAIADEVARQKIGRA